VTGVVLQGAGRHSQAQCGIFQACGGHDFVDMIDQFIDLGDDSPIQSAGTVAQAIDVLVESEDPAIVHPHGLEEPDALHEACVEHTDLCRFGRDDFAVDANPIHA
jgi:hypothetical protein